MSTKNNLSLSDCLGFLKIFISEGLIFMNSWIHNVLRELESLMGPGLDVELISISIGDFVLGHQVSGILGESRPGFISEWKFSKASVLVDYGVPHGVKVTSSLFVWKVHKVASEVTSFVRVVHSGGRVQWLVHVTGVVNQETQGVRESIVLGVIVIGVLHDRLVLEGLLIAFILGVPHAEGFNNLSDIVCISGEVEVGDFASLVKERLINEVPSTLP